MNRSHWKAGSLAAAAVASAITFSAPTAFAAPSETRECGLPAVPAVTRTVVVAPIFETVPAVTHTEWLWSRDLPINEFEFVRVISDARLETDWSRTVAGPVEHLFTKVVVDSPAVPAVPPVPATGHDETYVITPAVTETLAEYQQQVTGNLRWESDSWGAQNGQGNGWKKTGNTRAVTGTRWVLDTPAIPGVPEVPAVTHDESLWSSENPGAPWTGPFGERPGQTTVEHATTDGAQPDGDGWVAGATRSIAAVTETGWAEVVPAGTTPTGVSRFARTQHEETGATSADAPAGEGWSKVAATAVTITDAEAKQVVIVPGSTTEEVVTPALPATAPCPEPPTGVSTQDPQAGPPVTAVASPTATTLPNTGGVPGWMIPAGMATVLVGAVVVRTSRRDSA